MLCGNCGKREAEILIKQLANEEMQELSLCRACAEELGFLSSQLPSITISFSLREVEAPQRRKVIRMQPKRDEEKYDGLVCSACGMGYREFQSGGILGCAECYQAFRFPLGARLQRTQGAESHWDGTSRLFSDIAVLDREAISEEQGRNVTDEEREAGIRRLREEIEVAVAREEYERAAKLRDLLRPLLEDEDSEC